MTCRRNTNPTQHSLRFINYALYVEELKESHVKKQKQLFVVVYRINVAMYNVGILHIYKLEPYFIQGLNLYLKICESTTTKIIILYII